MRKYLLSGAIIGAGFGLLALLSSTLRGPRNLQLLLSWVGWAAGAAGAVLTVQDASKSAADRAAS